MCVRLLADIWCVTQVSDDMFFIMIKQLCKILEPFTLVIQAVQAACATVADVTRYWLYLAKMISQLPFQSIDSAFRKWCCIAFNMRQAEMLTPMCKLTLFLRPLYRDALAGNSSLWEEISLEAGLLWQRRGKHPPQIEQLMNSDMLKYRLHEAPYTSLPADGKLSTLKLYWQNIIKNSDKAQLPWLALFLLDIKPHAADPEKSAGVQGHYCIGNDQDVLQQLDSQSQASYTTVHIHHACNSFAQFRAEFVPEFRTTHCRFPSSKQAHHAA